MSVPKPKDDQVQLSEKKPEAVDKPVDSKAGVATEEHEISKEEEEEQEASAELDSILKRSPSTFVQTSLPSLLTMDI